MRAENVYKSCNNYLNGFNDVAEHKTGNETAKGLLKIASYVLIIPVIIAAIGKLATYKIVKIKALLGDSDSLTTLKTDTVFKKVKQDIINQKELVNYLVYKSETIQKDEANEITLFENGFRLLNFDSQKEFFEKITSKTETLKNALDIIPKDIQELNFSCKKGEPSGSIVDNLMSPRGQRNTLLFCERLGEFKDLKKLHLDLRGLGLFGPGSASSLKTMTNSNQITSSSESSDAEGIWYHGVPIMYHANANHVEAVTTALYHLREAMQNQNNQLQYRIDFSNLGFDFQPNGPHGKNTYTSHTQGVFEREIEKEWVETIKKYLNSANG